MKTLEQAGKVLVDGKPMSFKDFVQNHGGSEMIYSDEFAGYIAEFKDKEWDYVDDYIAPIVAQLIVDAAEIDTEVYLELMASVNKAYSKLKKKSEDEQQYSINLYAEHSDLKRQVDFFWNCVYTKQEIKDLFADDDGVIWYKSVTPE